LYTYGYFPSGLKSSIDHKDGIPSNNSLSNLRVVSHEENSRNKRMDKDKKLQIKGVRERNGRFYPRIRNPKTKKEESLGGYATEEEAQVVYEAKAKEYFEEFYRNNSA
jgi:hypothetical protein